MFSLLRQIRFPNLLIIALTFYSYRYFILEPFYRMNKAEIMTQSLDYGIMVIVTMLIAAAGYLVNDYCDLGIDRINRPDRPSVSGTYRPGSLVAGAVLLSMLSAAGMIFLSVRMESPVPLIVFLLALATVWLYAFWLKKSLVLGNLSVAFMSSLTLGMAWLFVWLILVQISGITPISCFITRVTTGIVIFAFLLTLIREIIKDMEDEEGDKLFGCRTLPVVKGIPFCNRSIQILSLLTFLIMIPAQIYLLGMGFYIAALWLIPMVEIPLILLIYKLSQSHGKSDYHELSQWVKWIMVGGISSMIVIGLTLFLNPSPSIILSLQ